MAIDFEYYSKINWWMHRPNDYEEKEVSYIVVKHHGWLIFNASTRHDANNSFTHEL